MKLYKLGLFTNAALAVFAVIFCTQIAWGSKAVGKQKPGDSNSVSVISPGLGLSNGQGNKVEAPRLGGSLLPGIGQTPTFPEPGGKQDNSTDVALVLSVCVTTRNVTESCASRSQEEAVKDLVQYMQKTYVKTFGINALSKIMTITFPKARDYQQMIKDLHKIENAAITIVKNQLKSDLAKLQPIEWDTVDQRQAKRRMVQEEERGIKQWESKAREEAKQTTNWERHENSFQWKAGTAYQQLQHINLHGWGGI